MKIEIQDLFNEWQDSSVSLPEAPIDKKALTEKTMQRIDCSVSAGKQRKGKHRVLRAALIAAVSAVLLCGSVLAYRSFVRVGVDDEITQIQYSDTALQLMDTYYLPSAIPEGYELHDGYLTDWSAYGEGFGGRTAHYYWYCYNESENIIYNIDFSQSSERNLQSITDRSNPVIRTVDGKEVTFYGEKSNSAAWESGGLYFQLFVSHISDSAEGIETLSKLIESVEPVEDITPYLVRAETPGDSERVFDAEESEKFIEAIDAAFDTYYLPNSDAGYIVDEWSTVGLSHDGTNYANLILYSEETGRTYFLLWDNEGFSYETDPETVYETFYEETRTIGSRTVKLVRYRDVYGYLNTSATWEENGCRFIVWPTTDTTSDIEVLAKLVESIEPLDAAQFRAEVCDGNLTVQDFRDRVFIDLEGWE